MSMISSLIIGLIGLAVPILAIVGLVSLLGRHGSETKKRITDSYFYFMAFVAILVLYWGVADLFRVILEKWWVGGVSSSTSYYRYQATNYAQEQWLRGLSLRVSAILVSLPIWFFHWHKAISKAKEEIDEVGKKSYAFAIVLIMGLSSIGMLIGALYLGVNALLGITLSGDEKQSLAFLLPYSIGALALWLSHWKIWHEGRAKEMAEVKMEEKKE